MKLTSCGAAEEVTGSCHLIEAGEHRILLDCGLIQGRRKDEARNREPFPFDPRSIDAVVLSHAHIDHSGRLPLLIKQGFRGPIYTHFASADLCKILLKDSASLNERDVEYENRRRERRGKPPISPLYRQEDVEQTIRQFQSVDYRQTTRLNDSIAFTFHDAGHIIGSAMVELDLSEGEQHCKLVFSGDLGHRSAPILRDFHTLEQADVVMLESTYGNRLHRSWADTFEEMGEVMDIVKHSKGNVLIPSFAVGRSQNLLYLMARNRDNWDIDRWQIFLDSPMAIEATEIYLRYVNLYDKEATSFWQEHGPDLSMPNLHFSRTPDESRRINRIRAGAIVIAGSGMCNGGRIRHHLKHNLWRRESHVIIPGFQSYGTLGRKLVEGAKYVKLWGEKVKVEATIHTIGGLSAHADQQGIVDWYASFRNRPPAFMVHGESAAMEELGRRIRTELDGTATVARAGQSYDLLAVAAGRHSSLVR